MACIDKKVIPMEMKRAVINYVSFRMKCADKSVVDADRLFEPCDQTDPGVIRHSQLLFHTCVAVTTVKQISVGDLPVVECLIQHLIQNRGLPIPLKLHEIAKTCEEVQMAALLNVSNIHPDYVEINERDSNGSSALDHFIARGVDWTALVKRCDVFTLNHGVPTVPLIWVVIKDFSHALKSSEWELTTVDQKLKTFRALTSRATPDGTGLFVGLHVPFPPGGVGKWSGRFMLEHITFLRNTALKRGPFDSHKERTLVERTIAFLNIIQGELIALETRRSEYQTMVGSTITNVLAPVFGGNTANNLVPLMTAYMHFPILPRKE
jgi:hypothetical protein